MEYTQIAFDVADRATITLDRPDRLNALTNQMMYELVDVDCADRDDDVRAVVVTGRGAGSAPAPTWERAPTPSVGAARHPDLGRCPGTVAARLVADLPLVEAGDRRHQRSRGRVGITMTLPMDVRLAPESARIGQVRGGGSSWRRPVVVPAPVRHSAGGRVHWPVLG
jgi:hypothetical protein